MGFSPLNTTMNLDQPEVRRELLDWVRNLRGVCVVNIAPDPTHRSLKANAYYRVAVVTALAKHKSAFGGRVYTAAETHEEMKLEFAPASYINPLTGEVRRVPGSTREMNSVQFSEYVDRCIAYAAEKYGLIVQTPEEFGWMKNELEQDEDYEPNT